MLKIIILMLLMIALISPAMGVGIGNAEFFDIEQGTSETISISFYTGSTEPDNNFTLQLLVPDDFKEWISVDPEQFILGGGATRKIDITVTVPEDAQLGDRKGELKYAGSNVMGEGQVGYTVATKTILHFKVVKEGAKKEVTFLALDGKSQIEANKIQKFIATIQNTGNIPTSFHTTLHILDKGRTEVYSMTSGSINLGVDEIETVSLFWEPADEGEYTGYFTIAYEDEVTTGIAGTVVKSDTFDITVGTSTNPIPSLPSNSSSQPILIGVIIGILVIAGILFVLFRRSKT